MTERVNKNKFIEDGNYDCDLGSGLHALIDDPEVCFHRCNLKGQFDIEFHIDYDGSATEELWWFLATADDFGTIKTGQHSYVPYESVVLEPETCVYNTYWSYTSVGYVEDVDEGFFTPDDADHVWNAYGGSIDYRLVDVPAWGDSTIEIRFRFRAKSRSSTISECPRMRLNKNWVGHFSPGTNLYQYDGDVLPTSFVSIISPWSSPVSVTEAELDDLYLIADLIECGGFIPRLGYFSQLEVELRRSSPSSHEINGFGYSYSGTSDKYPFHWRITRNASNLIQCYYKESGSGSWQLCPESLTNADDLCLGFKPFNQSNFRVNRIALSVYPMEQWVSYLPETSSWIKNTGTWTGTDWAPSGGIVDISTGGTIPWYVDFRPTKMKLTFTGGPASVTLYDSWMSTVYSNAAYASETEATLDFSAGHDIYNLVVDGATLLTNIEFYCEGEAP